MDIRAHQERLLEIIDRHHYFDGSREPLAAGVRDAFLSTPRHLFAGRYKLMNSDALHEVTADSLADHLGAIYANQALRHVDPAGEVLPSTNSEPSFILRSLERLDLRPGQRVLEVGSGCGWLAGIMGRMVGPAGHVTGIEIIESLAARSRVSLAGAGIENVAIVSADGAGGWPDGAPYDRVMFTAGSYDLPAAFFDQVRDGGLLSIPLQVRGRGGWDCDVLVLRKSDDGFRSEAATLAFFVKLQGEKAHDVDTPVGLDTLGVWQKVKDDVCHRRALWFGGIATTLFDPRTAVFRSFLAKVDPGFVTFDPGDGSPASEVPSPFGIVDTQAGSVAICRPNELVGYGTPFAFERFEAAYRTWCELGMPPGAGLDAEVRRSADIESAPAGAWLERRGDAAVIWSARAGAA